MARSINSLVWATDMDVLAPDHIAERHDGYWIVESPSNPTFWWGNFLLFDDVPASGDGERWEQLFAQAFAQNPEVAHRTLAWDRIDGATGAADEELVPRGYELERTSGLIARSDRIREHSRANPDVEVRALDPHADEQLWADVIEVQVANAPDDLQGSEYHRTFLRRRQAEHRALFLDGRGSWYVALLDDVVAGSLGIVVTDRRARYQTVDTAEPFRRRGIASRLVVEAARRAMANHPIENFVIAADPDYHAIGIYEGLGFERVELVVGAVRKPERS